MELSLQHELYVLLSSAIGGVIIGLFFDVFRIIRRTAKSGAIGTFVSDMLFWIIAAVFLFTLFYTVNSGQLRWYEFAAVGLGLLLYFAFLSEPFLCCSIFVVRIGGMAFTFVAKILLIPFIVVWKICKKPISFVFSVAKKRFVRIIRLKGALKSYFARNIKHIRLKRKKI